MKTLNQIREIIADDFAYLEQEYKVKKIGVFDPAASDSTHYNEVNILVEINNPTGWEYIDLHDYLESELEMKVNIIASRTLLPQDREKVQLKTVYF